MVRLQSDELAILLVSFIHDLVSTSASSLVHEPEVGKGGRERSGDVDKGLVLDVGQDIEYYGQGQESPWRDEEVDNGHDVVALL